MTIFLLTELMKKLSHLVRTQSGCACSKNHLNLFPNCASTVHGQQANMSDPLDIPSWARKSPSRTKKKKRTKKITQKQQQQIDQDKPVSLFGEKGGKLEAPVDKLNHHNLPARWFANSSHGPKEPTPAPTGNKVRPFPQQLQKQLVHASLVTDLQKIYPEPLF